MKYVLLKMNKPWKLCYEIINMKFLVDVLKKLFELGVVGYSDFKSNYIITVFARI